VTVTDVFRVVPRSEQKLLFAITQKPVVVGVDSSSMYFREYGGGVISHSDCGASPNHALLAIGFGTDDETGLDYYLLQNSWGTEWGENGYVRIKRGGEDDDGTCGV